MADRYLSNSQAVRSAVGDGYFYLPELVQDMLRRMTRSGHDIGTSTIHFRGCCFAGALSPDRTWNLFKPTSAQSATAVAGSVGKASVDFSAGGSLHAG